MKKILTLAFILIAFIPFLFNYTYIKTPETIQDFTHQLEVQVPKMLDRYKVPGAAMAVIHQGELVWSGNFGYADRESQAPISQETVFQVASVSKLVAAVGVMNLVEQGLVDLDEPVTTYLTRWELPYTIYNSQVTLRAILSHTAGLSLSGYPGYHPQDPLPSLEESLSGHGLPAIPVKAIHAPGAFSYSGGGYTLMELVIEEVTGMSFTQYMETQVLVPMGMQSSSFLWQENLQARTAKAYNENLELLPNYLFTEKAAAGLYTTAHDLALLAIGQYNSYQSEGLLSRTSMEEIMQPTVQITGIMNLIYNDMGLGHFIEVTQGGTTVVSHDGSNQGWRSSYTLVPETGDGIVILTNGNNGTYLYTQVQGAWHETIFQSPNAITRNLTAIKRIGYSISSIMVFWSLLAIYDLIMGIKKQTRGFTLSQGKPHLAIRILVILTLAGLSLGVFTILAPMVAQVVPTVGSVLAKTIINRSLIGMLQMAFPPLRGSRLEIRV